LVVVIKYCKMVMKQVMKTSMPRIRRVGVAEAKGKFSEVLREAASTPTIIHSRGHDLVVLLAVDEYERLLATRLAATRGGAAFLRRVDALKQRHGGGVEDFKPPRLQFEPIDPFARKRTSRS
jgi:prevent-host-death family protein